MERPEWDGREETKWHTLLACLVWIFNVRVAYARRVYVEIVQLLYCSRIVHVGIENGHVCIVVTDLLTMMSACITIYCTGKIHIPYSYAEPRGIKQWRFENELQRIKRAYENM